MSGPTSSPISTTTGAFKNAYLMGWMTFHAAEFLETFVEYPPSQEPASFTIDQIAKDVEARIKANAAKAAPQPR